MVNLTISVTNKEGAPVANLEKDDFRVLENEKPQRIAMVGAEEVPFNLALLLDWSSSTELERGSMKEAAQGFIRAARPQDRIAVYALVGNLFFVASRLTEDRRELLRRIEAIPEAPGGSPLYDAIALAYAEELAGRRGERNALLVISDGVDNQISHMNAADTRLSDVIASSGLPSQVSFRDLSRAAGEIDTMVYPVLIGSLSGSERLSSQWLSLAKGRLEEVADKSGGRLFEARSLRDLEPVYPAVAAELRSVYSLAYYPSNQGFDGSWRKIEVGVTRQNILVRSRTGYRAR
jgi:VWFA-related protein